MQALRARACESRDGEEDGMCCVWGAHGAQSADEGPTAHPVLLLKLCEEYKDLRSDKYTRGSRAREPFRTSGTKMGPGGWWSQRGRPAGRLSGVPSRGGGGWHPVPTSGTISCTRGACPRMEPLQGPWMTPHQTSQAGPSTAAVTKTRFLLSLHLSAPWTPATGSLSTSPPRPVPRGLPDPCSLPSRAL